MDSTLIAKLKDIQLRDGLIDREMAKRLGCSRQLWQMTRTGKTPLSNKVMRGTPRAFPELQQDVIYFLTNDAKKCPNNAIRNPLKTALSGLRNGIEKVLRGITRG